MKDLWASGKSDFSGKHFTMTDCKMSPQPSCPIPIVAAGQSGRGMEFAAQYADFDFIMGSGFNTPKAFADASARLAVAAAKAERDVGAMVLFMVIADETDSEAEAKWKTYYEGMDLDALAWIGEMTGKDKNADKHSTAKNIIRDDLPPGSVNMNMGTLVGSYSKIAGMLDEVATVEGLKGIMLVFDDFLAGLDAFGTEIQPLMKSREGRV